MFLWDTNILQFFTNKHPVLGLHLQRVSWIEIALPSVVVAEVLQGRIASALSATPDQAPSAHRRLFDTMELLARFNIVLFDERCAETMSTLLKKKRSKKRYADVMIAAMTLTGNHTLVTRNQKDFADLLPARQIANWIDEKPQ